MELAVGDPAPDFALSDADGASWSLSEQRGRTVVLYFYPKDDTVGCTSQACAVRDSWTEIIAAGAVVVGISPDDERSHRSFRAKHDLPQTLLVDDDRAVIRAYGAWGTKVKDGVEVVGLVRSSVVVAPDGHVAAIRSPIDPAEQVPFTLTALAALRRLAGCPDPVLPPPVRVAAEISTKNQT